MGRTLCRNLAVLAMFGALEVGADVAPPRRAECADKKVGDTCSAGVCTASTCRRPDYSKGIPPTYKEVPCLECKPAPSRDAGQ